MAHKIYKNTKNGVKEITLLNPAEKAEKFADELAFGAHFTNDRSSFKSVDGEIGLSDEARAYRAGYLDARRDSANAYIHRHPEYKHKTEGGKNKAKKRAERKAKKK